MADKTYKVGELIDLGYQTPNAESGLTGEDAPIAEIYLPSKVKDSNFPDVALVEVGSTGTYRGAFTPNEQGEWEVIMHKADGDGQVTRKFSVGGHNVHSVGEAVGTVDGKVDTVDGKASSIQTKVDGIDSQLDTVEGKIDSIDTKVSSLDTPPQAF